MVPMVPETLLPPIKTVSFHLEYRALCAVLRGAWLLQDAVDMTLSSLQAPPYSLFTRIADSDTASLKMGSSFMVSDLQFGRTMLCPVIDVFELFIVGLLQTF